jgi:hypothetical protein
VQISLVVSTSAVFSNIILFNRKAEMIVEESVIALDPVWCG